MACDSLLTTNLLPTGELSTDVLQVDCPNLLSTGLLQVVSTSCKKSANDEIDEIQLDEKGGKVNKATSQAVAFLAYLVKPILKFSIFEIKSPFISD